MTRSGRGESARSPRTISTHLCTSVEAFAWQARSSCTQGYARKSHISDSPTTINSGPSYATTRRLPIRSLLSAHLPVSAFVGLWPIGRRELCRCVEARGRLSQHVSYDVRQNARVVSRTPLRRGRTRRQAKRPPHRDGRWHTDPLGYSPGRGHQPVGQVELRGATRSS